MCRTLRVDSVAVMSADKEHVRAGDEDDTVERTDEESDRRMEELLRDPRSKAALLRKLGLDEQDNSRDDGTEDNRGNSSSANQAAGKGVDGRHPTLGGKSMGAWPVPPYFGWPLPAPAQPQAHAQVFPPFTTPYLWQIPACYSAGPTQGAQGSTSETEPGPSGRQGKKRRLEDVESEEEDSVELLDPSEALELVEFDPKVESESSWEPSKPISAFLEKHFNRSLTEAERKAILKDFPKPTCEALMVPKLDQQVKDQLKLKGKDPHFGAEKSLYKIQEQVLEAAGPLTCLWADLLNKEAQVSEEDTLLLIQRAFVLLGNASNSISQERRKVA